MRISVVIPCYNEEDYIFACLDALFKQSYQALEVIVVDNNSSDNSVSIAKRFPVKIVKEKRQGMIFARNRGFNMARGDVIARLDADCRAPVDWLATINRHFTDNTVDAVTGPIVYYDNKWQNTFLSLATAAFFRIVLHNKETLFGSNMALTAKTWKKIADIVCLDDKAVHEDLDLALHIHQDGGKILFTKDLLMNASARRQKQNPASFYFEYPYRGLKTLQTHI